jgi:hypothetical protein
MKIPPFIPGQAGISDSMQKIQQAQKQNNGVDVSYPTHRDLNQWADEFAAANQQGVMLRVAGTGSVVPPGSVQWTVGNTKIPHNLGVVPSGWHVTYKSKTCDIFAGTTPPDAQFIYLTITDDSADTNLFIF